MEYSVLELSNDAAVVKIKTTTIVDVDSVNVDVKTTVKAFKTAELASLKLQVPDNVYKAVKEFWKL